LPQSLVARVRTVHSLRDAVHRLAKADLLAAVPTGDRFCRVLDSRGGVAAVEQEYARAQRTSIWRAMAARVTRWVDSFSPAQSEVAETM